MPEDCLNPLLHQRKQFLGFVQRRVPDLAIAEDILQAAYIRAIQHQDELTKTESVAGWFYRVLRNAVIDYYRRRSTEDRALAAWGRELELADEPAHGTQEEICACLAGVLDTLKPDYAELLRAVELGEQSLKSFAQDRKISPANAGVRAHRARAALRRQLIKTCGVCAERACVDCVCRR